MLKTITNERFIYAFLLVFVGIFFGYLFRVRGILGKEGKKVIKAYIWDFALPVMAFSAFMSDFSVQNIAAGGTVLVSSLLFYLVFILLGALIFRRFGKDTATIASLMSAIGQLTLFTMPLIESLGLSTATFYCGIMTLSFRSVLYFIGYPAVVGKNTGRQPWKKVFLTPVMIAMLSGVFIFLTQNFIRINDIPILRIDISLPAVYSVMKTISATVMPLAMFLIGLILGESPLSNCLKDKLSWSVAVIRSFFCPLIVFLITSALPNVFDNSARLALTLGFAAPSSVTLCVFCVSAGKNEEKSSRMSVLSVLLSIIFVPLFTILTM